MKHLLDSDPLSSPSLLQHLIEDLLACKEHTYAIIKQVKRKWQMLAEGKLDFSGFETKSTNLPVLAEELLGLLHTLA